MNNLEQNSDSSQNDVAIRSLYEIFDYIEDKECSRLNTELLNFATDVQFLIKQKINELQDKDN